MLHSFLLHTLTLRLSHSCINNSRLGKKGRFSGKLCMFLEPGPEIFQTFGDEVLVRKFQIKRAAPASFTVWDPGARLSKGNYKSSRKLQVTAFSMQNTV